MYGVLSRRRLLDLFLQADRRCGHGTRYTLQEREITRLERVGRPVIMGVPKVRRVGQHQRRIAVMPEGGMVASPGIGKLIPLRRSHKGHRLELSGFPIRSLLETFRKSSGRH